MLPDFKWEKPRQLANLPVNKTGALLRKLDSPLGDRCNMVYKGAVSAYSRGIGVVIRTGMDPELGKNRRTAAPEKRI
ncbi:MAG: hypothetical protein PHC94_05590 [Methylobacter sp.]|nr:hypothetical protein [Methylobacter sp.]